MATLQHKTVVVVGGSSGIGFAVALAALQSQAKTVIIASSSREKVDGSVERLKAHKLPGEVRGEVLDARDSEAVKNFAVGLGSVDHIVWSSGDNPGKSIFDEKITTVEQGQATFTIRFWGPFILAQHAKFNPGGSLTLTSGGAAVKPWKGAHLGSGMLSSVGIGQSAIDGLTRGLAVDLAPVRVNLVCPGMIDTELFDAMLGENKAGVLDSFAPKIVLKRAGQPSEIAEAYTFLMKCGYITGQVIYVEGGMFLI